MDVDLGRFAGLRTFTLLGTAAGIAGVLIQAGLAIPAAMLITGVLALIVAGYVRAGVLAGIG